MMKYKVMTIVLLLTPLYVNAIGINSMLEFTYDNKAEFTITNSAEYRQFIHVGVSEIKIENGEIETIPYTRENIEDWSLSVSPSRTVIDPSLKKTFQITYEPKNSSDNKVDKAYRLSFIPTPYFEKGEPVTHAVQVAIGFAPTVIVPAKSDMPINYRMSYDLNDLKLKNNGGTYIRAFIDGCPLDAKDKDLCSTVVYALSGRNLPIDLNTEMKKAKQLKVELTTHNLKYKESFEISRGNVKSNFKDK
ncbi:hypothetical protein [Photobacterium leiognathi]|uniref:hypothetical protein n=1 Tax=Photobacterium leiognathi TaxID=553611 RepID=UPI0029812944|nr:hypothetical protein [Photobacterium leiognathi]